MPRRKADPIAIRQELMVTKDGIRAHDLIRDLMTAEPSESIPVLIEYANSGPLDHVRTHVAARLAKLVPEGDVGYVDFFEKGLTDPHLAYWSIEGLVRVAGQSSFPVLTQFALNAGHRVDDRAKAVREMALLSGQQFIQGLPADPGHWNESDLPITQVRGWSESGYPRGRGFAPPERDPRLDSPRTSLDRAASKLDMKLAKLRQADQDPVNPNNWLVPASQSDLDAIQARWRLPSTYLDFLRYFSPLRVNIVSRRYYQGLDLYGAADLLDAQHGYAFNPLTGERIDGWPAQYVVIATHAGDPFVLDLSNSGTDDAPVLTAVHDEPPALRSDHLDPGWDFSKEAPSFLAFLERLSS